MQIQDKSDSAEDGKVEGWKEPEPLAVSPSHQVKPGNAYLKLIDM